MAAKSKPSAPADKVELYERLIATLPDLAGRKGAALPYTSVNGNMFSVLGADGTLGLRLGQAERAAFLEQHDAALYEAYGVVMKEYVAVPAELLADTPRLAPYLASSWTYAQSLRPKPTTRPKKA